MTRHTAPVTVLATLILGCAASAAPLFEQSLGRAGDVLAAQAKAAPQEAGWFDALAAVERARFVEHLNTYELIVQDAVRESGGRWLFARTELPTVLVVQHGDDPDVPPAVAVTLENGGIGTPFEKRVRLAVTWEAPDGESLRVDAFRTARRAAWVVPVVLKPAAPATQPTTAQALVRWPKVAEGPPPPAPRPAPATGPAGPAVVEIDRPLGSVGQVLLQRAAVEPAAFRWFARLPAAERQKAVVALDAYLIVLRDDVRKAGAAWQFVDDRPPRAAVLRQDGGEPKDAPVTVEVAPNVVRAGEKKQVRVTVRLRDAAGENRAWAIPVELGPSPE